MQSIQKDCHAAGGAVRDLLLGRPFRDVDYVFTCPEQEFIQGNPSARKIENRGAALYLLRGQEFSPLGALEEGLEKAFARDLECRDFTMNALLLSAEGLLRAHPLALRDLREGCIRPASATAMRDDPVRVFRAARFACQFPGFFLHGQSLSQMRGEAERGSLAGIAAEQIGNETRKACASPKPGNFLRTLAETGCLQPWFAEFSAGGDKPAGPPAFHKHTVLEHSAAIMDAVAAFAASQGKGFRALAVWMALCHDIGKNETPDHILPHHYGHEESGRESARALGLRLRLPSLYVRAGELAASLHMTASRYAILRPGTKVDLLMAAHSAGLFKPFSLLVAADAHQETLPSRMQRDLDLILGLSLPFEWRNRGPESGRRLRQMRCEAIAAAKRGCPPGPQRPASPRCKNQPR